MSPTPPPPSPAELAEKTDPQLRMPFPVPWGLLIVLGLYALCVLLYLTFEYWRSPGYQAALHYEAAEAVLHPKLGHKDTREELLQAYDELLEAARLMPQVTDLHRALEALHWRIDRFPGGLPADLKHRSEAVGELWRRIQEANEPLLVVGARDRGWAPDQLARGPKRVLGWSALGFLLILVVGGYRELGVRKERGEKREAYLQEVEREVKEAGQHRTGLKEAPRRYKT